MDDKILSFLPSLTELDERHQTPQTQYLLFVFIYVIKWLYLREERKNLSIKNKQDSVSLTKSAKIIRHYTTCSSSLLCNKMVNSQSTLKSYFQ